MNPKLSLAIGICCISFSPIFVKLVPIAGSATAFYRMAFAWLFLVPYCLYAKNLRIRTKDLLITILAGSVFALDIALWNVSILKSTATVSTLIANLAPLWVGLLSLVLFKRQPGVSFWLGTFIAIAGMVVLAGINTIISLQLNEGITYAVIASILYAIYILLTKNVLRRVGTLPFMFYNMLAAAIFLFCFCSAKGVVLAGYSTHTWLLLAIVGLVCQLIGWITINYAISYIDPTRVAVALLSQTVMAAILARFILDEHLGWNEFVGGFIVLVGIGVTFVKKVKNLA